MNRIAELTAKRDDLEKELLEVDRRLASIEVGTYDECLISDGRNGAVHRALPFMGDPAVPGRL